MQPSPPVKDNTAKTRRHRERARKHGETPFSAMLPKEMLDAMDEAARRMGIKSRRALLIRLFEANPNIFEVATGQGALDFEKVAKRKPASGANR